MLEHFTQFVVYLLMGLFAWSKTGTLTNISRFFVSRVDTFLVLSACFSLLSFVWGQITYVAARKDGHLPIVGKCILTLYFCAGAAARVLAVVLLFTPSLGLFDALYHFKLGQLDQDNNAAHDVLQNDTIVTVKEAWEKLKIGQLSEFVPVPHILPFALISVVVAVHLAAGCCLLAPLQRSESRLRLFLQSVFTLVCPPVFADWEEFQRHAPGSDILSCWKKSQSLRRAFVALAAVENLLLLAPILSLKLAVDKRNALLEREGFPPIPMELHSTQVVNALLFSGLGLFLVVPFLQALLADAYYKRGHAWSRILNEHLALLDKKRRWRLDLGASPKPA